MENDKSKFKNEGEKIAILQFYIVILIFDIYILHFYEVHNIWTTAG